MKKLIGIAVIVLLAGLAAGLWLGRPAWRRHKEARLEAQMRVFLEQNEIAKARMSARAVLQINLTNLPATLAMAYLSDQARSPHTLVWRQRALELAPLLEHRLRLAEDSLRYEGPPYPAAAKTLRETPAAQQNTAAYHSMAARLALRLRDNDTAIRHLEEALKIEPGSAIHTLNLAVLRLLTTNATAAAESRATLDRLSADPALGVQALRTLVTEYHRRADWTNARRCSERLLRLPEASFGDRIDLLQALAAGRSPDLAQAVAAAQAVCATNLAPAHELTQWMIEHQMAPQARQWLESLPASARSQPPVPLAIASCFSAAGEWTPLEAFLRNAQWGEQDFLRHAILARALRQEKELEVSAINWRKAVRQASSRPEFLAALAEMARTWGWTSEREELLWLIADKDANGRWAIDLLHREYLLAGNTAGLQRVAACAFRRDASNPGIKNDLAALNLLLGTNLPQAHQLAREAYQQATNHAALVSTYAYSLHVQGRTPEALAVLQRLKPQDLREPSVALYYGVLLAQAGLKDLAREYLALAQGATLLPEEKALFEKARRAF